MLFVFALLLPLAPACCSSRYGLALLSCYGFFVVYSLRVNLSVAMVDMLNNTHEFSTNHSGSVCPAHASPERPKRNHTVSKNVIVQIHQTAQTPCLLKRRNPAFSYDSIVYSIVIIIILTIDTHFIGVKTMIANKVKGCDPFINFTPYLYLGRYLQSVFFKRFGC